MKKIPLRSRDGSIKDYALVDDKDFDKVNQWRWSVLEKKTSNTTRIYAVRRQYLGGGRKNEKSIMITLHRFLMNFPEGKDVDHADGNGLNNQRKNLRICSRSENLSNQGKRLGKHKFKGVYQLKNSPNWYVQIQFQGKRFHGKGGFKTAKEAAIGYNELASRLFGRFARLNEVDSK